MRLVAVVVAAGAGAQVAQGMQAASRPFRVELEGGCAPAELAAVGNAFNNWYTARSGFNLCHQEDGFYYVDGAGQCSGEKLTCSNAGGPSFGAAARGVTPQSRAPAWLQRAAAPTGEPVTTLAERLAQHAAARRSTADAGASAVLQRTNLIVMLRWTDEAAPNAVPTLPQYEELFNSPVPTPNAPTGSAWYYFNKASSGQFNFTSYVSGWIDTGISHSAANSGGLDAAMKAAIDKVEARLGAATFKALFDKDNDGVVDIFTAIHSGIGSENVRDVPGLGNNWIWSHKANMQYTGRLSGLRFSAYNVFPGRWYDKATYPNSVLISHVGVACHENVHVFGLPDYYDTGRDSQGIGMLGLMGNSWGPDWSQQYPSSLSPFAKTKLGWITVEDVMPLVPADVLASPATKYFETTLELEQVQTSQKVLRIRIPGSTSQYFFVENRPPLEFDGKRPGGILIWHIDETFMSNGNNNDKQLNPEIKSTWASSHYGTRLVTPDLLYTLERKYIDWQGNNSVTKGQFWGWGEGEQLGDSNLPGPSINTYDAFAAGKKSYINLSEFKPKAGLSMPAAVMTFKFSYGTKSAGAPSAAPVTPAPVAAPTTKAPVAAPVAAPTTAAPVVTPTKAPVPVPTVPAPTTAAPVTVAPTTKAPVNAAPTTPAPKAKWQCPASWFNAKDGCDCECSKSYKGTTQSGATNVDPDCLAASAQVYCGGNQAAAGVVCDLTTDRCVAQANFGGSASPEQVTLTGVSKPAAQPEGQFPTAAVAGSVVGVVALLVGAVVVVRRRNSSRASAHAADKAETQLSSLNPAFRA